jgi:hypothetical protein
MTASATGASTYGWNRPFDGQAKKLLSYKAHLHQSFGLRHAMGADWHLFQGRIV